MPKTARIGDPFTCGDHIAEGSPDVLVNNIPVARLGDATTGHGCWGANALAEANSVNVYANGILVSHLDHSNEVHCCPPPCHTGTVSEASADVITGG